VVFDSLGDSRSPLRPPERTDSVGPLLLAAEARKSAQWRVLRSSCGVELPSVGGRRPPSAAASEGAATECALGASCSG
jgi:hypothetical protein